MQRKICFPIIVLLVAMGVSFLIGWRVMPRIWPTVKSHLRNIVTSSSEVQTETETQTAVTQFEAIPYVPDANTALGDPITTADSVIYYFYKPFCPYCAILDPLFSGLPQTVTLPDGTTSRVKLIVVNKEDEVGGALISDYYAAFDIPDERQFVPAVLIGNRYMLAESEILDGLMDALMAGEGRETPLIDGSVRTDP